MIKRIRLKTTGLVQGVGFRPFVYNLAQKYSLAGWVRNDAFGAIIEVEGRGNSLNSFLDSLTKKTPPLAHISSREECFIPPLRDKKFKILKSKSHPEKFVPVTADIATCPDCLHELSDSKDFRYHYPFINCTNCGPRFTIIKGVPYDRSKTTMASFKMCSVCRREYNNPRDRRFHAQPVACPKCGPVLSLLDPKGKEILSANKIEKAKGLLRKGKIVAIKGIGGFHLAVEALNQKAVRKLRQRKFREDKPFALMADSIETIKKFCLVDSVEEKLLLSIKRPIVLLRKKENCLIPEEVAPKQKYLGFMLPYSGLHHLLFESSDNGKLIAKVLVMTSGNVQDEPIAYSNREALRRLEKIADYFLTNNRDIYIRVDDSVTRVIKDKEFVIRRSRGYVPYSLTLPFKTKPILACGAELKNTFCLTKNDQAFLGHHIGDLKNLETLKSFEKGIAHFKKLFNLEAKIVAYDLHPEYLSSKYASALPAVRKIAVQHHHAHIVSCMTENGLKEKVIGVAFDGSGYGSDGKNWGGEFLITTPKVFLRAAHWQYIPLLGGDKAVEEPWRMGISYLYSIFGDDFLKLNLNIIKFLKQKNWQLLKQSLEKKINTPLTSSIGRLFDAVSSILGLRYKVNYEGQAAVELEMIAEKGIEGNYNFSLDKSREILIIEPRKIIKEIVEDLNQGVVPSVISAKFHNTLALIILKVCKALQKKEKLNKVALSGGVFQNIFLLNKTINLLEKNGFKVFIHHQVPTNDGGICLGQAVIAQARVEKCV